MQPAISKECQELLEDYREWKARRMEIKANPASATPKEVLRLLDEHDRIVASLPADMFVNDYPSIGVLARYAKEVLREAESNKTFEAFRHHYAVVLAGYCLRMVQRWEKLSGRPANELDQGTAHSTCL